MNRWTILALQLVALWPVAGWYARRLYWTSSYVELAPIVACGVALAWGARRGSVLPRPGALRWPALCMGVYALSALLLPTGASVPFAVLAVASTVCSLFLGWSSFAAIFGLGLLALPALPILQFELSYPLRVLVAECAAPLLRAGGVDVVRSGTCLEWAGGVMWVDAPCSGVRFLWTGFLLLFSLALLHRLGSLRTIQASGLTLLIVIAANVLRTASLFYLESGILPALSEAPDWAHSASGLVVYGVAAFALAAMVQAMSPDSAACEVPCASS